MAGAAAARAMSHSKIRSSGMSPPTCSVNLQPARAAVPRRALCTRVVRAACACCPVGAGRGPSARPQVEPSRSAAPSSNATSFRSSATSGLRRAAFLCAVAGGRASALRTQQLEPGAAVCELSLWPVRRPAQVNGGFSGASQPSLMGVSRASGYLVLLHNQTEVTAKQACGDHAHPASLAGQRRPLLARPLCSRRRRCRAPIRSAA